MFPIGSSWFISLILQGVRFKCAKLLTDLSKHYIFVNEFNELNNQVIGMCV